MSTSNNFFVFGCYGTMTVEIGTGNVLDYEWDDPDEKEYSDIARIDIQTFEMTLGLRIMPEARICIMDFNFWTHDGQYNTRDYPYISVNSGIHSVDNPYDWPQPIVVLHKPVKPEFPSPW